MYVIIFSNNNKRYNYINDKCYDFYSGVNVAKIIFILHWTLYILFYVDDESHPQNMRGKSPENPENLIKRISSCSLGLHFYCIHAAILFQLTDNTSGVRPRNKWIYFFSVCSIMCARNWRGSLRINAPITQLRRGWIIQAVFYFHWGFSIYERC